MVPVFLLQLQSSLVLLFSNLFFVKHFTTNVYILYIFVTWISYRKLPWVVVNRELKSTLAHHGWGNTSFLFFMKYSFSWGNTHHGCGIADNHGRGSTYFLENNYCIWPMTRMTMEAMGWSLKIRKSWGSWNLLRLLKDVQVGAFPSLGRQYENNGFGFRWGISTSGYVICTYISKGISSRQQILE